MTPNTKRYSGSLRILSIVSFSNVYFYFLMFEDKPIKICKLNGCKKPETEFFSRKAKNGQHYLSPYCKECERKKAREYKKKRYHDPSTRPLVLASIDARVKTPEYRVAINDKLRTRYETDQEYRQSILDARREVREDPEKNRKIRERAAVYYQENKSEIIRKAKEKKLKDPKTRLRGHMRGRISEALAAFGKSKGGTPSLAYLPYTWNEFYQHIESQFEDWMSFSNYGPYSPDSKTWQIDHIIPQNMFPYDSMDCELFHQCWDLENLRPLESKQNFTEGDRILELGGLNHIRDLLANIRDGGVHIESRETLEDIKRRLSKSAPLKEVCPMSMVGLSYLDSIFNRRFEARTASFPSLVEALNDDKTVLRTIRHIIRKGDRVTRYSVLSNLRYVVRTPGHFFPSAAYAILQKYAVGKHVFDPFLGWGGRALAASMSDVASYTGCDLQSEVVNGCHSIIDDMNNRSMVIPSMKFVNSDCLLYMNSDTTKYDLIFSSPPFMDTENYGVESDAMRQNWLDDFVFPFAKLCLDRLADGGYVALHLKDLKGAPTFTAYHAAMKAFGMQQVARYKYGRTWTQSMYIYSR